MIVLGINGSPDGGHDASACIVRDGHVLAMGEEERFSRQKHAYDVYPHAAATWCLDSNGLTLADVDVVAFAWDLPGLYAARGRDWSARARGFADELFPARIFGGGRRPPIEFVSHHASHAASCLWPSGFEDASILVVDGQGEGPSVTMAYGHRARGMEILSQVDALSSLGYLYKAASGYLGFGRENPGKTMGLAAYGEPDEGFGGVRFERLGFSFGHVSDRPRPQAVGLDDMEAAVARWDAYFRGCGWQRVEALQRWDAAQGAWHFDHPDPLEAADRAASVQRVLERTMLHLASEATRATGCRRLAIAGGVGLNCAANGRLLQAGFEDLFVFPAAGDSGTALGAALHVSHLRGVVPQSTRWKECFLGPEFTDADIDAMLSEYGVRFRELGREAMLDSIADALADEKIVAVFHGRSEIGPRALGHRSILAAPHSTTLRDRVNRVKGREWWRPLGPSVLESRADEFFERSELGSHFMLRALRVRPVIAGRIAGAVHVDGTARVQLVREESFLGGIVQRFASRTGLPLVLNTSFNLAGEPIVGSPRDALRSFLCSGIDVLAIGHALIDKRQEANAVRGAP